MGSLAHGKRESGKGEKPDDRWAVPLCAGCHLDGPGATRHIDALLEVPELTAIQYVIGAGAEIGAGAVIGPGTVVGPASRVGRRARLARSILWPSSRVAAGLVIEDAVVIGRRAAWVLGRS